MRLKTSDRACPGLTSSRPFERHPDRLPCYVPSVSPWPQKWFRTGSSSICVPKLLGFVLSTTQASDFLSQGSSNQPPFPSQDPQGLTFSQCLSLSGWKTAPSLILISFHHLIKIPFPAFSKTVCLGCRTSWAKTWESGANVNESFNLFFRTLVYNSVTCSKLSEELGITKTK